MGSKIGSEPKSLLYTSTTSITFDESPACHAPLSSRNFIYVSFVSITLNSIAANLWTSFIFFTNSSFCFVMIVAPQMYEITLFFSPSEIVASLKSAIFCDSRRRRVIHCHFDCLSFVVFTLTPYFTIYEAIIKT